VPAAGVMAVGGEVGLFVPDDVFEPTPIVGGFFEYYPTARLSLRPSVMFLDAGFDRHFTKPAQLPVLLAEIAFRKGG